MISKIFDLEIRGGELIITPEVQDCLLNSEEEVKVSLKIESSSVLKDSLQNNWDQWFEEVEEIEPICSDIDTVDNYPELLIDNYKKQGLDL